MLKEGGNSSDGAGGYALPASEVSKEDQERLAVEGTAWRRLVRAIEGLRRNGITVNKLTVRGQWSGYVDILIILCADTVDGPVVAFHGAESVSTMWDRLARRIESGGLKWRNDNE